MCGISFEGSTVILVGLLGRKSEDGSPKTEDRSFLKMILRL
jgi:hypothetical protein